MGKSLFFLRISEQVFLCRISKYPAWLIILILLGCVERITGNSPVSSLTDVSARVRFAEFAILTCLFTESPIRTVSGLSDVELAMIPLAVVLALVFGLLFFFFGGVGLVSLSAGSMISFLGLNVISIVTHFIES